ncbi:SLC13 family permease [Gloeocapsa sp. PCC 73106]|uniref:SLC13 family permease n=1 Tax=Gloeocapsa sp. PCC 73106 TaxID=102232 RepID=UPI0002ABE878|nr:SLC13 family permease [Gloeocapsa sp. PCC 73106]ELR99045.1 di-/tricarboxylate transporter [Gloeocapsa sp. PCC 73106]
MEWLFSGKVGPKGWGKWGILAVLGLGIVLLQTEGVRSLTSSLSWQAEMAIAVTVIVFLGSALSQIPTELVFLGGLGLLAITGILKEADALAGFSNPGMMTVAVLYIVVAGLEQTGGMAWISQRILGLPKGLNSALLRLMLPVVGISAFLNNTPVVAIFIKVVDEWSRKLKISPSKLMIPLSYASIFGGICTLIGTSTNLVVNGLLISEANHPGLGMFQITPIGLPCAIVGVTYTVIVARWLLPERISFQGETEDPREYTVEMVVQPDSPLVGQTIEQAGLRHLPSLFLSEIDRNGQILSAVSPQIKLQGNDQLIFVGAIDSIVDLQRFQGLLPATNQIFKLKGERAQRSLIEAVVSNTCPLVGQTIREGHFRNRYNAVVLAVCRNGERIKGKIGDIKLAAGDTLLLEARSSFIEQQRNSKDFYLVSGVPNYEPVNHVKAPIALGILVMMVILSLTGLGVLKAAIIAAILMLATRCCSAEKALKSIEWSVLLVIAAALGIGRALETTGAAGTIAERVIGFVGDSPWVALVVIYAMTAMMTEIISNNAAAALNFPIALAMARNLEVDLIPFAIAVMIAASSSFSTPIGYQTNLMVYGPGGYRFTDFLRIGIPLNLLFGIVALTLIPLVYSF